MSEAASSTRSWSRHPWQTTLAWTHAFVGHRDPLVEANNWVAFLVGTHLPFWPLYVAWSAGAQAFPTALLTVTLAPLFLAVPLVARRSGLLARAATPLVGIANTVFTVWVLGANSGTALFFVPCTVLAAISFRRSERWLMLVLTTLPVVAYFVLQYAAPVPLHRYDAASARSLFVLNAISVAVLLVAVGWLQADVYRRMEKGSTGSRDGSD